MLVALELDIYCCISGFMFLWEPSQPFHWSDCMPGSQFHAGVLGLPVAVAWRSLLGKSVFSFYIREWLMKVQEKDHNKPHGD